MRQSPLRRKQLESAQPQRTSWKAHPTSLGNSALVECNDGIYNIDPVSFQKRHEVTYTIKTCAK